MWFLVFLVLSKCNFCLCCENEPTLRWSKSGPSWPRMTTVIPLHSGHAGESKILGHECSFPLCPNDLWILGAHILKRRWKAMTQEMLKVQANGSYLAKYCKFFNLNFRNLKIMLAALFLVAGRLKSVRWWVTGR